jgi:hypothetical protein
MDARRDRKLEIIKYLANPNPLVVRNKGVPIRRLVGAFTTMWGVSARVIYQYLDEHRDAGLIQMDTQYIRLTMSTAALNELFGGVDAWKAEKETKPTTS